MQTDPVSEALCFLEYRTMGKIQKLSNPENIRTLVAVKDVL
jgi:hypothetical protein